MWVLQKKIVQLFIALIVLISLSFAESPILGVDFTYAEPIVDAYGRIFVPVEHGLAISKNGGETWKYVKTPNTKYAKLAEVFVGPFDERIIIIYYDSDNTSIYLTSYNPSNGEVTEPILVAENVSETAYESFDIYNGGYLYIYYFRNSITNCNYGIYLKKYDTFNNTLSSEITIYEAEKDPNKCDYVYVDKISSATNGICIKEYNSTADEYNTIKCFDNAGNIFLSWTADPGDVVGNFTTYDNSPLVELNNNIYNVLNATIYAENASLIENAMPIDYFGYAQNNTIMIPNAGVSFPLNFVGTPKLFGGSMILYIFYMEQVGDNAYIKVRKAYSGAIEPVSILIPCSSILENLGYSEEEIFGMEANEMLEKVIEELGIKSYAYISGDVLDLRDIGQTKLPICSVGIMPAPYESIQKYKSIFLQDRIDGEGDDFPPPDKDDDGRLPPTLITPPLWIVLFDTHDEPVFAAKFYNINNDVLGRLKVARTDNILYLENLSTIAAELCAIPPGNETTYTICLNPSSAAEVTGKNCKKTITLSKGQSDFGFTFHNDGKICFKQDGIINSIGFYPGSSITITSETGRVLRKIISKKLRPSQDRDKIPRIKKAYYTVPAPDPSYLPATLTEFDISENELQKFDEDDGTTYGISGVNEIAWQNQIKVFDCAKTEFKIDPNLKGITILYKGWNTLASEPPADNVVYLMILKNTASLLGAPQKPDVWTTLDSAAGLCNDPNNDPPCTLRATLSKEQLTDYKFCSENVCKLIIAVCQYDYDYVAFGSAHKQLDKLKLSSTLYVDEISFSATYEQTPTAGAEKSCADMGGNICNPATEFCSAGGFVNAADTAYCCLGECLPKADYPDLVIKSITTNKATYTTDDVVKLTATIQNASSKDLKYPSNVESSCGNYFPVIGKVDDGKIGKTTLYVRSTLKAGESEEKEYRWATWWMKPGLHTITIEVDPQNCVKEFDETNNTATLQIAVYSPEEICWNNIDDDNDGSVDEGCFEICNNGKDDDNDGSIDEECYADIIVVPV